MGELKEICESIVKFKEYNADSIRKRSLYQKCLSVENQMFKTYLKTGKQGKTTFPFNELGFVIGMKHEDVVKTAKIFYEFGWNPTIHVKITRRKFEDIMHIGKSLII